ncbi:PC4-domain-containing protein [Wolfiporia cocos MD-104 SS10]|uniref:PC4-domain-containing protein n=1 Tax=Wolfiporia cocos (strain MD-104) TaxID=742152 RepID=A0A2H3K3H4_WOLCO|nr:PC4-domain-containing protein [Wolfiporia cocos MD-104 SS10]
MVKRKSAAAPRDEEDAQEYASDSIPEPPVKRKTAKTPTVRPRYDQEEEEEEDQPPRKRASKSTAKPTSSKLEESEDQGVYVKANDEGEKYIDLGKKRRATVRSFKGTVFLDIREYYGAEGDEKPGKKGISLSLEQWQSLKNASDAIDTLFKKMTK